MKDREVTCPECAGDGGCHGFTGGYTVTGSGYGDATPDEGFVECARCDGTGAVDVDSLSDDEWSRLGEVA